MWLLLSFPSGQLLLLVLLLLLQGSLQEGGHGDECGGWG